MPRVLDKDGRELSAGSPVRFSQDPLDEQGEIKGPRWLRFSGWSLESYWRGGDGDRYVVSHELTIEDPESDTYRCNDLELVETAKEAAPTALTKGEK